MLKSASALRLINVDWSNGRRVVALDASDRYEYQSASDKATQGASDDPPAGRALRPAPPAWRACRADMPRMHFLCLACGWAGAALALLVTVLLIRVLG
jgi:hypothetical protein